VPASIAKEDSMKIRVGNIDFHCEIHGREGLPWLTLSHSLACNLHMWDPQIEALSDRWRIFAYDSRGHGLALTGYPALTTSRCSPKMLGLLTQLGIDRTHFAGLSIGA
jgi:3-oxoadipate enol-lactonase